ncbi:MAG: hypothetical protein QOD83_4935, partial [Solirubrobacteraceae bacterium]|nr:hypothetical protein [Solirubrobacteraceae bacterium]
GRRQAPQALPGSLFAVDTALGLDLTSVLLPVWQAAVAVRLGVALRAWLSK